MIDLEPFVQLLQKLGVPTAIGLVLVLFVLLMVLLALAVRLNGGSRWRDPVRFFTYQQKRQLVAQAHGRCEHKSVVWRRCLRPGTDADHVIPWSRGGGTVIENGQLLCRKHNKTKSNYVPNAFYQWRLARRRRKYRQ